MVRKKQKILLGALCLVLYGLCVALSCVVPERIVLLDGEPTEWLNGRLLRFELADAPVGRAGALVNGEVVEDNAGFDSDAGSYTAQAKLFGLIPVRTVTVDVVEQREVIAGGAGIGVRLYTGGLLVVGVSDFNESNGGTVCPPREADVRTGDLICAVDGQQVSSIGDFVRLINQTGGNRVTLTVERNGKSLQKAVTPRCDASDGKYKLGLWVRDSTAGIGTMTFIDPHSRTFGALGHGISDADTGTLLPVGRGDVLAAEILSVKPSEKESPGELRGAFAGEDTVLGEVTANTDHGLYGSITRQETLEQQTVPIAGRSRVQPGPAQILCSVSGREVSQFDIEIERVSHLADTASKGMVIRITDPDLLEVTGGIVQGMSGSPIIQNGMIVGAVTHVFVNDPTRGYGIFIENMLAESEKN